MRRPTSTAIGILLLLTAPGCGGGSSPSSTEPGASTSPTADAAVPGRIVFRRYLSGSETQAALFTSNADGSDEFQLTRPKEGVVDDEPSWSPDGRKIVFTRFTFFDAQHESRQLFVVAADGSGLKALSPNTPGDAAGLVPGWDGTPAFSPDGKQIAFSHAHGRVATGGTHGIAEGSDQLEHSNIFVMDADGRRRRQVTHFPAYSGDANGIAWSPDGTRLTFARFTSAVGQPADCRSIFVIDVDGKNPAQLTECELGAGGTPAWSKTGLIGFRAVDDEESGIGNFFTIKADGGDPKQVTHFDSTVISHKVGFSPDGTRIVFSREVDGANDIFTSSLDGSDVRPVTTTPESDSSADWGPAQ